MHLMDGIVFTIFVEQGKIKSIVDHSGETATMSIIYWLYVLFLCRQQCGLSFVA